MTDSVLPGGALLDVDELDARWADPGRPELVLLFKEKEPRPKDQAEFGGIPPLLSRARRDRLSGWLERVHRVHPWLAQPAE